MYRELEQVPAILKLVLADLEASLNAGVRYTKGEYLMNIFEYPFQVYDAVSKQLDELLASKGWKSYTRVEYNQRTFSTKIVFILRHKL